MDAAISSISAPQAAPVTQPDVRPTADAAALARDPSPTPAMAIPASMGQSGAVNESRMTDTVKTVTSGQEVERVLKPYGVAMLPERAPTQENATSAEADVAPQAEPAEG